MKTSSNRERTKCQKVTETTVLILTWISLGMYLEIFGPTLKDLILRLDSNYEQLAFAISGRTFGWILGSVLGGFLVDKFQLYRHMIITVALMTAAIATVAIPWLPNITLMWIFCFIGGVCEQVVNIAGTSVTLSIWLDNAASLLILLHMGYGIGSFIVPLYAYPFLAERTLVEINETSDTSVNNGSATVSWISLPPSSLHGNSSKGNFGAMKTENKSILNKQSSEFVITGESRIEYAYGIAAASLFLCSVSFLVYQILEVQYVKREQRPKATFKLSYNQTSVRSNKFNKNTKEMTFLQMINPATCADGRLWYGLKIFAFIFIFMGNLGGCERMIGSFIRSFAIDQLEFSSVMLRFLILPSG